MVNLQRVQICIDDAVICQARRLDFQKTSRIKELSELPKKQRPRLPLGSMFHSVHGSMIRQSDKVGNNGPQPGEIRYGLQRLSDIRRHFGAWIREQLHIRYLANPTA